jgi:coenzyme F420-0:L-glutamate ligase/coenzyme F420-1:gamma-L-glutamate ligase
MTGAVQLIPLPDFPLVQPGDDLAALIGDGLRAGGLGLLDGDLLVVAQKVVSKAENRYVRLADVAAGDAAVEMARRADKDPRQVELILRESREVLRVRPGVIIVEHKLGYVHANAGIDKSNIPSNEDDPAVLLLPEDPDRSAASLRDQLGAAFDADIAVIINDSAGRAWRNGTVGFAIGCAGIEPVHNQIGEPDLFGRLLEVTEVAVADELAAAASFVMGQAAEACPVVLVRGAQWRASEAGSRSLLRERALDMFR